MAAAFGAPIQVKVESSDSCTRCLVSGWGVPYKYVLDCSIKFVLKFPDNEHKREAQRIAAVLDALLNFCGNFESSMDILEQLHGMYTGFFWQISLGA
jgi:hypothetical protein